MGGTGTDGARPPAPRAGDPPGSPGAAATPAAAGAIHGKGPARVQSRRRRRPPRVSGPPPHRGPAGSPRSGPRGVGPPPPLSPRAPPRAAAAPDTPPPAPPRGRGEARRGDDGDDDDDDAGDDGAPRGEGRAGPGGKEGGLPGRGRGRRRLVQPRRAPSPASRPSPTDPALRANPYPEVTDPACRLPLPTLFQHARGCSPWRPAADMGTARREIYTLSPGFSRASESSPDAAGTATLSKARAPLSGRTHSRAPCPSQRKENSPRGSRRLLRDRSRYRTGRLAAPISATPDSGI